MGFSTNMQLLAILVVLMLESLSSTDCAARNVPQSKPAFLELGDAAGSQSLVWNAIGSRLRREAQAEEREVWEALRRELERSSGGGEISREVDAGSGRPGGRSEDGEGGDGEEERHPADVLLQRQNADATISYILGGY